MKQAPWAFLRLVRCVAGEFAYPQPLRGKHISLEIRFYVMFDQLTHLLRTYCLIESNCLECEYCCRTRTRATLCGDIDSPRPKYVRSPVNMSAGRQLFSVLLVSHSSHRSNPKRPVRGPFVWPIEAESSRKTAAQKHDSHHMKYFDSNKRSASSGVGGTVTRIRNTTYGRDRHM